MFEPPSSEPIVPSRVLVIGGGSGIGEAIVRELVARDCLVDFTAHRSTDHAQQLVKELDPGGERLRAISCDLSSRQEVERLGVRLEGERVAYQGFVYNAGVSYDALVGTVSPDRADEVMQVNFWAMVRLFKVVTRQMARQRRGSIVLVSSVVAMRGNRGNAIYAASKAAIEGFTRSVVEEVGPRGVTVNCVAPGYVDTPLLRSYQNVRAALTARIPAQRYGTPGEVAGVVAFLLSAEAAYVCGATIVVDGGLSASIGVPRR